MKCVNTEDQLDIQERQYDFPYHYIPSLNNKHEARCTRALGWGLEYLCYQYHIVNLVLDLNPSAVLEVGCGDGHFIGALGDRIKQRVGVDFSDRAIQFGKAFHPKVEFVVGDARGINGEFDVVVAIEVLEHIPDHDITQFLSLLVEKVRPGGHLIICVPSVVLPLNPKHFRHYTEELLVGQVQAAPGFINVQGIEHICHIPGWMEWYYGLTINRHWTIEIGFMTKLLWQHIWRQRRIADSDTGRHIVGCFKK